MQKIERLLTWIVRTHFSIRISFVLQEPYCKVVMAILSSNH